MPEPRMTGKARRHRIGDAHIRHALAHADEWRVEDDYTEYVGVDSRGLVLEVGVVPDNRRPGRFAILHAMPRRFREK